MKTRGLFIPVVMALGLTLTEADTSQDSGIRGVAPSSTRLRDYKMNLCRLWKESHEMSANFFLLLVAVDGNYRAQELHSRQRWQLEMPGWLKDHIILSHQR